MEHLDNPSLHFNDAKMARFCSIALGGRGLIVPFYSVHDCTFPVWEWRDGNDLPQV